MPLAGFEPTIPASERPQTHALDCLATGIGRDAVYKVQIKIPGVTSQNSVVLNKECGVQTFTPHVATEYRNFSRQFKKAIYVRTYHQHANCLYYHTKSDFSNVAVSFYSLRCDGIKSIFVHPLDQLKDGMWVVGRWVYHFL